MAGGSFVSVDGNGKKLTLADLSVGYGGEYQEPFWNGEYWEGYTDSVFMMTLLNNDGSTKACYTWIDKPDDEFEHDSEWVTGWAPFTEAGTGDILKPEDCKAIEFASGQAFWIYGASMKLVSSGAVGMENITFVTESDNNTAICNGTGRDWTLGDVSVGYGGEYQEPFWNGEYWEGYTDSVFMLTDLNNDGSTKACYTWIDKPDDEFEHDSEWVTGWAPFTEVGTGDILLPEELAEITIPTGHGYWVYGAGMSLKFKKAIPDPEPAE